MRDKSKISFLKINSSIKKALKFSSFLLIAFLLFSGGNVLAKNINFGVVGDNILLNGSVGVGITAPRGDLDIGGFYTTNNIASSSSWVGAPTTQFIPLGSFNNNSEIKIVLNLGGCGLGGSAIEYMVNRGWNAVPRVYYMGPSSYGSAPKGLDVNVSFKYKTIDTDNYYLGVNISGGCADSGRSVNAIINAAGNANFSSVDPVGANYTALVAYPYLYNGFEGNVGIGIAPTTNKLDVNGVANFNSYAIHNIATPGVASDAATKGYVDSTIGSSDFWSGTKNGSIYNGDAGVGNVGIGTTNPGVKFVNSGAALAPYPTLGSGTVGSDALLSANGLYGLYTGVSSNGDVWQQVQRNDANAAVYRLLLNPSGGNVGVGTTNPLMKLDVKGNAQFDDTGTYTSYSWAGGTLQTNSVEILDRVGGSTSDGIYPTLTFHDYGNGGAQFSMEGLTTTLHLGSGQSNSAGTLGVAGGYFSKLKIWGALETTGAISLGGSKINNLGVPVVATDAATKNYVDSAVGSYLNTGGDSMSGVLTVKTPPISTAITGTTNASIEVPIVNVGTTASFLPFLHQRAVYTSGYITHLSLGILKDANAWSGGFFVGLGGSDSNPTDYYKMSYGGTITYSTGLTFLSSGNYNSYSPTLTGGGASGTWGINITGNANTLDGYNETSFLRLAANSGSPTNGTFAIGTASGRNFIQSHAGQPLDINPLGNVVSVNGATVITAANVGSQSVNYAASAGSATNASNVTGGSLSGNLVATNYGIGNMGVYDSTRYQAVWSMGTSWLLPADGSSPGNLYGLAWTHSNAGGQSKAGLSHQLLVMENGITKVALGSGIWTSGAITAPTVDSSGYVYGAELYTRDNVYLGYMGNWLSNLLNQSVRTDANPTFNDIYSNSWIRNSGRLGLYNQTQAVHFYADSPSYWRMSSNNGMQFNSTSAYDSAIAGYVYHDAGGFGLLSGDGSWKVRTYTGGLELYGSVYAGGSITAGSYVYTSDINLKKNIVTIQNPLEKILQLRGVTFDWKKDSKPSVGLIAQEVEKVFPELVSNDGKYKGVQYGNLVAPLIEAVKEQQKQIEELKAGQKDYDLLKVRIKNLETKTAKTGLKK